MSPRPIIRRTDERPKVSTSDVVVEHTFTTPVVRPVPRPLTSPLADNGTW
jgi:hypothetical protein